jgi:hypothetical protein
MSQLTRFVLLGRKFGFVVVFFVATGIRGRDGFRS